MYLIQVNNNNFVIKIGFPDFVCLFNKAKIFDSSYSDTRKKSVSPSKLYSTHGR